MALFTALISTPWIVCASALSEGSYLAAAPSPRITSIAGQWPTSKDQVKLEAVRLWSMLSDAKVISGPAVEDWQTLFIPRNSKSLNSGAKTPQCESSRARNNQSTVSRCCPLCSSGYFSGLGPSPLRDSPTMKSFRRVSQNDTPQSSKAQPTTSRSSPLLFHFALLEGLGQCVGIRSEVPVSHIWRCRDTDDIPARAFPFDKTGWCPSRSFSQSLHSTSRITKTCELQPHGPISTHFNVILRAPVGVEQVSPFQLVTFFLQRLLLYTHVLALLLSSREYIPRPVVLFS